MFLSRLEINGFKSFAQKTVLEFKPGITAIVGPNGSGKSNVADAVRWVLGEQSIKMLRGKKSEDVIFSGSDKKARLGLAEVSLYLNNERDEVKLGMSEICITRRLYRDGESEYLINQQKTRLLDIQMLLAKSSFANTSYSIIGQGMIDSFLLASPAERKEFFEEASGVKPLQIKREQCLNKLCLTEENLETAKVQLNEIEPRLNSLTRQVKKLEKRAGLETQLKESQKKYYGALWQEVSENFNQLAQQLRQASQNQEKEKTNTEKWQSELSKLTRDVAQSQKAEELQKEYQEKLLEKMKLNEKVAELKIKLAQISASASPSKTERGLSAATTQEIIKTLNTLNLLNEKIKKGIASKKWEEVEIFFIEQEKIINEINQLLAPFQNNQAPAVKENEGAQKIKEWQLEIKNIDEAIANIQSEIKKEYAKEKSERSQIWEIQQQYQSAQQKLNQVSGQVNDLRVETARWETKKDDLKIEIEQELDNLEWLTPGLKQAALSVEEKQALNAEIIRLKHQLDLIGGIDPEVQKEHAETATRFEFLSTQINDLASAMKSLEELIKELDESIRHQFENNFHIINEEFQKHFKILFAGGRAKLVLLKKQALALAEPETSAALTAAEALPEKLATEKTEEEKIRERLEVDIYEGVEIEATPPGKKLKSISMLSGGERALTSIALICAIIAANPSPFIVLDEVDAALDESNSIRLADILEQLAHRSQFIVISHNRATMEKSDILYGVTMGDDGVSKLLSLKLESAAEYTNR